jgi:pimeloyl-ACP methyl ester carboxylesterase
VGFRVFAPTANVAVGRKWSLAGLARRVDAICRALDVPRCPVVGHSFGGVIAAKLAIEFPERVSALVAVNSALVSPGRWQLVRLGVPGPHYRMAAGGSVVRAFARAQRQPETFAHIIGSIRWMLSTDLANELPTLRARGLPSAILWALETCLSEHLGLRAAELMGARFLAVAPTGDPLDHLWPLRDPEMFVDRVAQAVLDLTSGSALDKTAAAEASSR